MFSSQSSGAVNSVVTEAVNAVSDAASGAANSATSMINSINQAANTAVNNVAKNIPMFNSLIPIGNNARNANNTKTANNAKNANTNIFSNVLPTNSPINNSGKNTSSNSFLSLYIFMAVVLLFIAIFAIFNREITNGYEYISESIKKALNYHVSPDVIAPVQPTMPVTQVTVPPEAPQDITPDEQALPQPSQKSIVERILPPTGQEVFNVAQNKFSYYDAEPLCRALGAELATYEQVKDAWGNGADWCNYGWVKGQMAVYPTQKETYEKLQSGPVDERNACGTVGINGGYFDNPEFKYGVNCYGKKPPQSAHDQQQLMSEGKAPKSPDALKVDKMVAEFRDQVDSLFVKPFSNEKWAAS